MLKLDPRTKTILFFIACVYSYTVTEILPLIAIVFTLNLVLALQGHIKIAVKMFVLYIILQGATHFITSCQSTGLTLALMIILGVIRMFLPSIMAFVMLFLTTKISEFMSAFEKLRIPNFVMIPIVVMVRFMPTVKEEWQGINNAMAYRGINLSMGKVMLHPIKTAEYILVPLLFSCVHIMDELVASSMVRGLDNTKKRVCYFDTKLMFWDYFVLLICICFVVLLFLI